MCGEHWLAPEDYVLVSMYIGLLFPPICMLIYTYRDLGEALTVLEKAVVFLMLGHEVADKPDAVDLLPESIQSGDSVFENVSFCYKESPLEKAKRAKEESAREDDASSQSDSEDDICEKFLATEERSTGNGTPSTFIINVSFRIPSGHTVAIVGSSGSGKSMIWRLLLRIYDVDEGRVLIGGRDVRDVKQNSLCQLIGHVSQDVVLFNDTICYNVQYGAKDASDAKVMDSLRAAALGSFLESHVEGLDYKVGNRGWKVHAFRQLSSHGEALGSRLRTALCQLASAHYAAH